MNHEELYDLNTFLKSFRSGLLKDDEYGHPVYGKFIDDSIIITLKTLNKMPKETTHILWKSKLKEANI